MSGGLDVFHFRVLEIEKIPHEVLDRFRGDPGGAQAEIDLVDAEVRGLDLLELLHVVVEGGVVLGRFLGLFEFLPDVPAQVFVGGFEVPGGRVQVGELVLDDGFPDRFLVRVEEFGDVGEIDLVPVGEGDLDRVFFGGRGLGFLEGEVGPLREDCGLLDRSYSRISGFSLCPRIPGRT